MSCTDPINPATEAFVASINPGENMTTLKRGTYFLHSKWLSSLYTPEECRTLPAETVALKCKVTKVELGAVYYRPVYQHGDREELGKPLYFAPDQASRYVLKVL